MRKSKKNFLGLLGLALVAAVTVFAYLLPPVDAFADTTSVTETIRVTVYDSFPSIKIDDPATDYVSTSPEITVAFTYENASYVDFKLSYVNEDGDTVEVALPRFTPDESRLDPTFHFDSDSNTVTFNLLDPALGLGDLPYEHYILSAVSGSPIGESAGDSIEFDYVPVKLEQTGSEAGTNDPTAEVTYDDGVAKIEVMPIDSNGNPLFDEPVVIEVEQNDQGEYEAGSKTITLPFTSYGFPTGEYDILVTAYGTTVTPGEIDPDTGEQGEDVISYILITSPLNIYHVSYVQPPAPDVPNTGGLLKNLNLASEDVAITAIIAFGAFAIIAFLLLARRKKDYRKNLRRK